MDNNYSSMVTVHVQYVNIQGGYEGIYLNNSWSQLEYDSIMDEDPYFVIL